jgi:flagellar biosynthetic protein FliR
VLDLINYGAEKVQLFILLMMRTGGILMTAPIFSHNSIPRRITIAMTLGLTVVLMPLMANFTLPQSESILGLIFLSLKEVFVGVIIGLVFTIIFIAIRLSGSIVGYQIGFAMVNVVDPNSPNPVSILGEFWYLVATLIFLMINGHHIVISGLVDSFKLIPLGTATPSGEVGDWFIKFSSFVFVLAIKFAAPVIITVFLTEVAMGVLARTMPQMNIFIVGFPLKIFVGLFLIAVSLPAFSYVLTKVCASLDGELAYLMKIYNVSGTI